MTISGDWRIAEQPKYAPNGHYGFTYIPVPKAGDHDLDVGRWLVDRADPGLQGRGSGGQVHAVHRRDPDGQKVYTKESTHLPTLNALLADSSLYDAQHAQFLALLPTAKSRPPLAVGAAYWDALTSAPGFGRAQHQAADGCPQGGPAAPSSRSSTPSAASHPYGSVTRGDRLPVPAHLLTRSSRRRGDDMAVAPAAIGTARPAAAAASG